MAKRLKDLVDFAKGWSDEDQAELVQYAREIEARRTGRYEMTREERAAVVEGLAQIQRGEFASDADMQILWSRLGIA